MDDLPAELSKRMSRRQFLFGNRGGDPGVPVATGLGIGGIALGIMALGSPKAKTLSELGGATNPHDNAQHVNPFSLNPHDILLEHTGDVSALAGDSIVHNSIGGIALFNQNQVVLTDEFLFGTTEDGEIGELGWSVIIVGTGNTSKQAIAGRPGVTRIASSATAGDNTAVKTPPNSILTSDPWDLRFIAKGASASMANQIIRLGVGQALEGVGSGTVRRGYWFEADDSRSANWLCVTANNTSRTEVNSGIAVNNSTWHLFRVIYNVNTAAFDYYIDGSLITSISTTLPGSVNAELTLLCWTRVTSAIKNVDIDWFRGALIGVLAR